MVGKAMTRIKVVFADIEVELESEETSADLIDKMSGILGYLIPERIRFNAASLPCEEDSGCIPPQQDTSQVLPAEIMKAYL